MKTLELKFSISKTKINFCLDHGRNTFGIKCVRR